MTSIKHLRQRVSRLDEDDPRRDRANSLLDEAEIHVENAVRLLNEAAEALNQPWLRVDNLEGELGWTK